MKKLRPGNTGFFVAKNKGSVELVAVYLAVYLKNVINKSINNKACGVYCDRARTIVSSNRFKEVRKPASHKA